MPLKSVVKPAFSLLDVTIVLITFIITIVLFVRTLTARVSGKSAVPQATLTPDITPADITYEKSYVFSSDWFTQKAPLWAKVMKPFAGKPNISYLEVGVFEGRATIWMLENILTHPTSKVTAIDLFDSPYTAEFGPFKKRFITNVTLSGSTKKVTTIHDYSQNALRKIPLESFTIVYIDGSHENRDVLEDAILSARLVKQDGLLIFDDYGNNQPEFTAPKNGIRVFMKYFGEDFQVLSTGQQLILKKTAATKKVQS